MTGPFYKQCVLYRELTKTYTTTWILEKFSQVGRPVRLKQDTEWEDGWVVSSVGARATEEQVAMMERDHTRTRKHSDI